MGVVEPLVLGDEVVEPLQVGQDFFQRGLPLHRELDQMREEAAGAGKIGTT